MMFITGIITFLIVFSSIPIIIGANDIESICFDKYNSIIIGPYYHIPSKNSVFIMWQTSLETTNNSVHFGLNVSCDIAVYNYSVTDLHKVFLNNLEPSTRYYYRVVSDDIKSNIYTFYTEFDENDSIRFIVYGDTRGVWDNWKNARIVAESIEKENPFFVLHTGDLVKNGHIIEQWFDFFSVSSFIHNSTLYPVLGNHEYYGDPYSQYFPDIGNGCWYSFDQGKVHFIGLDSNKKNAFNINQMIWLINDLISNDRPFIIVFFHHPPYSSGSHGSTIYLRWLWGFVFNLFDVDIVFNGHDHSYERALVNNINYVVTGGGGAPLYNVGKRWWTIYSEKTYHYCLVTINLDELLFQAKKIDGSIIDSFSIRL